MQNTAGYLRALFARAGIRRITEAAFGRKRMPQKLGTPSGQDTAGQKSGSHN